MKLTASLIAVYALMNLAPAVCSATAMYTVTDLGTLGGGNSHGYGINASGEVTGTADRADALPHAFLYDGTMHDLGDLGGNYSDGYAINASGQITGDADTTNALHAFLFDGTMHDLGSLLPHGSIGKGINDGGQVTGYAQLGGYGPSHAFLYDGTIHDLGTLGGSNSFGYGINASGQVVGYSDTANSATHAFLYDGQMHDLGTLIGSSNSSYAYAINAGGQVTGFSDSVTGLGGHAFLYDGAMHDLGTLGGDKSEGLGINSVGQVTGWSYYLKAYEAQHAFIYDSADGIVDLNSLISPSSGWTLAVGESINDRGQITGFGYNSAGLRAFLLTPVPEPSTLLLTGLGMIGVLGYYHRARTGRLMRK
jgi:probable HAF family extracellular repeat protein